MVGIESCQDAGADQKVVHQRVDGNHAGADLLPAVQAFGGSQPMHFCSGVEQRAICCQIFTPAALPEYPAASLRDYCSGAYRGAEKTKITTISKGFPAHCRAAPPALHTTDQNRDIVELMTEKQVLGFEPASRLEDVGAERQE
jgi:hypothetical protein